MRRFEVLPPVDDPRIGETRRRVFRATWRILEEEGLGALTPTRVAARSGCARSTIYRHWPTNHDLVADLVDDLTAFEHTVPTGRLRNDLCSELVTVSDIFSQVATGAAALALGSHLFAGRDPDESRGRAFEIAMGGVSSILRQAAQRGHLAADIDVESCLALLGGPIFVRAALEPNDLCRSFIATVVDSFLATHAREASNASSG